MALQTKSVRVAPDEPCRCDSPCSLHPNRPRQVTIESVEEEKGIKGHVLPRQPALPQLSHLRPQRFELLQQLLLGARRSLHSRQEPDTGASRGRIAAYRFLSQVRLTSFSRTPAIARTRHARRIASIPLMPAPARVAVMASMLALLIAPANWDASPVLDGSALLVVSSTNIWLNEIPAVRCSDRWVAWMALSLVLHKAARPIAGRSQCTTQVG
jgi:hypothetical protein